MMLLLVFFVFFLFFCLFSFFTVFLDHLSLIIHTASNFSNLIQSCFFYCTSDGSFEYTFIIPEFLHLFFYIDVDYFLSFNVCNNLEFKLFQA